MWLRNCWYVIAWDHEIPAVGSDELFSRTVLGEPVLVLRTESGALAALEDRCCHRLAPLSKGRREGDCVRCGYHGLMFDASGQCVDAPGLPIIPPKARVRTYPCRLPQPMGVRLDGRAGTGRPRAAAGHFSCA
jgi:vanillate O-demethylase monooxygenase subunit